jgi:hypothetical protein
LDFGGFFVFGLLALVLALYVAYARIRGAHTQEASKIASAWPRSAFGDDSPPWGLAFLHLRPKPLASAAAEGDLERVRFLLKIGASPNAEGVDNVYTALTGAADAGHTGIVRLLLQKGADPLLKDGEGQTAMECAKRNGHTDIVRILEEAQRNRN